MYELKLLVASVAMLAFVASFQSGLGCDAVKVDELTAGAICGGSGGKKQCPNARKTATVCCHGREIERDDVLGGTGTTDEDFGARMCAIIGGGGCTFTAAAKCN